MDEFIGPDGRVFSFEEVEAAVFDSTVEGYCHDCGEYSDPHEPDARSNWCPHCESNAVESILSLFGLI